MALTIDTLNLLNSYILGVMDRADHHGENVNEIVLTLAGAVVWKATQDVEVRMHQGSMANVLWLTVGVNRYAIAYNHNSQDIEIRERSQQGDVIATFNNQTTNLEVKQVFAKL
jgi:hypothetical protein